MKLYLISSNRFKINEVKNILESDKISVIAVSQKIHEIQSENMIEIVKSKATEAFKRIRRPLLVEQTGLLIKDFGNLPGGLTQIFWDSLQADKFGEIFSNVGTAEVTAKTVLGFCDGRKIHIFEGTVKGTIISPPRGNRDFQWDCVFQPEGYEETFAEMGTKKDEISMRKKALEKLRFYLEDMKYE